jgi:NADH-quinone oxidoreductase subunit N
VIQFDYLALLARLLPEAIIVLGGLIVLFADQARAGSGGAASRTNLAIVLTLLSCGLAIFLLSFQSGQGSFYHGMLVISGFSRIAKICLLILLAATVASGIPARFTNHIGEYVTLLMLGTVGLLFLVSTEELLTAFIALELTSLSLYLLAAFNKTSATSAEGALKYFLFGSVSAAFTLFGISLIFGLSGSTSFEQIAARLTNAPLSPLLIAGIVLTVIGFGFKLAAAPMHLWAPDAYQGAPAPSAAFIASGSKLASLVVFTKFFVIALGPLAGSASFGASISGWAMVIAVLATVSIVIGNLLAIAQSNFRRLIAYSAVAHAGYALIAVLAASERGLSSGLFYMFTYGLAVVGIFAIIGQLERTHGDLELRDFAGLSRRSPLLAICLFIFILSLAGIPPLAGFFGKFYVFLAALDSTKTGGTPGLLWIVVLAIAGSAVSLYYYLQVLKQAFVVEADGTAPAATSFVALSTTAVLALAVLLLGCFPQILLEPLESSLRPLRSAPAEFSALAPDVSAAVK